MKPPLASDGHPGVGGRYPEPDGHPASGPAYPTEREAREPDASAVPEATEAFLREHLGDEIYDQILHDDIPGMADLMGLDPDLVEAAGPAAAAAIAGTAAFSNLQPREAERVNREIVRLAEGGHPELANALLFRVGSQNSLGPDHNRYAMTNDQLRAANVWDERKRDALRAMTDLPAIPPHAKVLAGLLAAAMQSNIDARNDLIERRAR